MNPIQRIENNEAWQRFDNIRKARAIQEGMNFYIGSQLHIISRKKLYDDLGYDSFRAFLADPEVNVDERSAYRWMRAYEVFVLATVARYQLEDNQDALQVLEEKDPVMYGRILEAGATKLEMVASKVTDANMHEWINRCSTQTKGALLEAMGRDSVVQTWMTVLEDLRLKAHRLSENGNAPEAIQTLCGDFWRATEKWC